MVFVALYQQVAARFLAHRLQQIELRLDLSWLVKHLSITLIIPAKKAK